MTTLEKIDKVIDYICDLHKAGMITETLYFQLKVIRQDIEAMQKPIKLCGLYVNDIDDTGGKCIQCGRDKWEH